MGKNLWRILRRHRTCHWTWECCNHRLSLIELVFTPNSIGIIPLLSHSDISPSAAKAAGGVREIVGIPLAVLTVGEAVVAKGPTLPFASVQTTA